MSLAEYIDTTHWCTNCSHDCEDDGYEVAIGYDFSHGVGDFVDEDEIGDYYVDGWRCDSCETIYTDSSSTTRKGFVCVECNTVYSTWHNAANCCVWVCEYDKECSCEGDEDCEDCESCSCADMWLGFKHMLFSGELLTTYAQILESKAGNVSQSHWICVICHDIRYDSCPVPSEHNCEFCNRYPAMKYEVSSFSEDLDWLIEKFIASWSSQEESLLDNEDEINEKKADVAAVVNALLDTDPPPVKASTGCFICDQTSLCCVKHGTHKSTHRGCDYEATILAS